MTPNQIRTVPGWEDANDGEIQMLLNACAERWHRGGTVLIDGAKPAIGAMLIVSGDLQSSVEVGDMAMPVEVLGPGHWIGTVSALDEGVEGLTIRAVSEARVLVMSREGLERFRSQPSPMALRAYRMMVRSMYTSMGKLTASVAQVQRAQAEKKKMTRSEMTNIGFSRLSQLAQQAAGREAVPAQRSVEIVQHEGVPIAANFRAMR